MELGNFSLFYYPESIGSHQVSFIVSDNYGQEVGPVIIDLETKQNDFTVNITPSKTSEFANIPVNVIIDINEIPEGTNDTYEAFYSSGRNSSLRVNGTEYGPGEKFLLGPNNNNVVYTGIEAGQHDIVLSVESSANVTHTANTSISYNQVDFLFTGGSQKSDISVGEITSLNFNISESVGSSDYTMRYSLNGNALISNENGVEVSAGNIYDVPKGNFNWSLEGTDESNITLTFYVQNDTGLEKTVSISINISPKNYNFTANAVQSEAYTGDVVDINFNISELGIGGDTYIMYSLRVVAMVVLNIKAILMLLGKVSVFPSARSKENIRVFQNPITILNSRHVHHRTLKKRLISIYNMKSTKSFSISISANLRRINMKGSLSL